MRLAVIVGLGLIFFIDVVTTIIGATELFGGNKTLGMAIGIIIGIYLFATPYLSEFGGFIKTLAWFIWVVCFGYDVVTSFQGINHFAGFNITNFEEANLLRLGGIALITLVVSSSSIMLSTLIKNSGGSGGGGY